MFFIGFIILSFVKVAFLLLNTKYKIIISLFKVLVKIYIKKKGKQFNVNSHIKKIKLHKHNFFNFNYEF